MLSRYLDSKKPKNVKELYEQLLVPFPDALNPPPQSTRTELAALLNFPNPVLAEMAARVEGIREKISDVIVVPTPAEHDLAQKRAVPQATRAMGSKKASNMTADAKSKCYGLATISPQECVEEFPDNHLCSEWQALLYCLQRSAFLKKIDDY